MQTKQAVDCLSVPLRLSVRNSLKISAFRLTNGRSAIA